MRMERALLGGIFLVDFLDMNRIAQQRLHRPVAVQAREGFRLWLRYDDGVEGEVDLSDLAGQGVFRVWQEEGVFADVRITPHRAVAWGEDIELCADMLYERMM